MLNLVHQDLLDQYLGQNVFTITLIQVEGSKFIKNQYLYMDQFKNQNLIFHTLEDTSFGYHRQF